MFVATAALDALRGRHSVRESEPIRLNRERQEYIRMREVSLGKSRNGPIRRDPQPVNEIGRMHALTAARWSATAKSYLFTLRFCAWKTFRHPIGPCSLLLSSFPSGRHKR